MHFDMIDRVPVWIDACLPCDDAVALGIQRRDWHRDGLTFPLIYEVLDLSQARLAVCARRPRVSRTADDRGPERDYVSDEIGDIASGLPGEDASKAPSHEINGVARAVGYLANSIEQHRPHLLYFAGVSAPLPPNSDVSSPTQIGTNGSHGSVVDTEAGDGDDRPRGDIGSPNESRKGQNQTNRFTQGSELAASRSGRRRGNGAHVDSHNIVITV